MRSRMVLMHLYVLFDIEYHAGNGLTHFFDACHVGIFFPPNFSLILGRRGFFWVLSVSWRGEFLRIFKVAFDRLF